MTTRMRRRLGACVGEEMMPVSAVAERYRVCERTVARAFTSYADTELAALAEHAPPAQAAGVDEFRRGTPAPAALPGHGLLEYLPLRRPGRRHRRRRPLPSGENSQPQDR